MNTDAFNITRRQTLAGLGATTALTLGGCSALPPEAGPVTAAIQARSADFMLEKVAYNLLQHEPERATGLGVDTGEHAGLRGKLEDQSPEGQAAYAAQLRADLEIVRNWPREGLDADTLTNLDVVASGYEVALAGFALPYGDVPVGSWRTAPYVVIQNVGSYLDLPRFMDSTHPLNAPGDFDDYVARLEAVPGVFGGELERMRQARAMGVTPPDFPARQSHPADADHAGRHHGRRRARRTAQEFET